MARGTASSVRRHGFLAPAAGKTGTSHDAWFAGYSSNLLCIIWVGNDDYTDVKLQGADAAAPIWAEFMNRAIRLPQYSDMKAFTPPDGVEVLRINRATNMPIDESCSSDSFPAAFLIGTTPQGTCSRMGEDTQSLGGRLLGNGISNPNEPNGIAIPISPNNTTVPHSPNSAAVPTNPNSTAAPTNPNNPAEPHRNAFQKLFGLGKNKQQQPQQQPQ